MTQPSFVPIVEADQVRRAYKLQVPNIWTQSRPSELRGASQPAGQQLGRPGPDQGFALKLAHRFADKLVLGPGESVEDAIAGCTAVAMRRSARFGRAPVIHDLTFAFTLFGFLGEAPADLVEARGSLFRSVSHHYKAQRTIADSVTEPALRLTPEAVAAQLEDWRSLVSLPEAA
jgi:alkanesulfonate monooxygenase SsuD/methylene tetrahydromethanopterin reductase-like flavin-dependent oxidoreductase (luciferase family)